MLAKICLFGLTALGALLVLAACNGDGGDGGGSAATPTSTPEATAGAEASPSPEVCPTADGEVVQSLFAILEPGKPIYQQGEPVELTLRLINCASEPITHHFRDAQRYDFAAKVQDGDEVWRWSGGMDFAQVEGEETFQPAQEVTFTETWDQLDNEGQPVAPGQYEVTAESTGCDDSPQNCGPRAALFVEIKAP